MERPTLEDQIRVNNLKELAVALGVTEKLETKEELEEFFAPLGKVELWIYHHFELLWHIIYWNWFDIWEGIEDVEEHREWFIKLKRKLFGGNKKK